MADLPELDTARQQLGARLQEREAFQNDPDIGIQEKDQRTTSERAFASGDYAPGPSGMTYSPWDPRENDASLPPGATQNEGRVPSELLQQIVSHPEFNKLLQTISTQQLVFDPNAVRPPPPALPPPSAGNQALHKDQSRVQPAAYGQSGFVGGR